MKKILFLLGLSVLTLNFSSCSSDDTKSNSEESDDAKSVSEEISESKEVNLVGTWSAIQNAEGDGPMEPVNEGVTLSFTEDLQWNMAYNGTEFAGGEYETQAGQVFCYVNNKQDEQGPQQYVWKYYMEGENMILDGYYFKGNDKVNLKIVTKKN